MAIKDFSKWLAHPALQPQNMTALLVLLGQGNFIAEDVVPVVPSTDDFQWLSEVGNDAFLLSKKRGEKGLAEEADLYDVALSGSAYEYFVKSSITAKTLRSGNIFSFVNLLVRKSEMIARKIRLSCEKDLLDTLQDTSTYTTINTVTASAAFDAYATSDPYRVFEAAKNKILTTEFVTPDTVILGATDKSDMSMSDSIRDTKAFTSDYTAQGDIVERINGLNVLTSTAQYKTINTAGNYVSNPVLNGKAIILKKGLIGELREAQAYNADSDWDKSTKVLEIYGSRVIKPIVTRPQGICIATI